VSYALRPMTAEDAEAVAALSADVGAARWDAEAFRRELLLPHARLRVVEGGASFAIAAFAVWWHVVDEVHLLNIVVAPELRRAGVARALMEAMIDDARRADARALELEVRAGNAPAIALYTAYGFAILGRRKRYYADGEDALLMERVLA
jgi:ribosomal-protein-alanine acetyltransferase